MSDLEGLMHGAGIYHMFDKDGSGKVEWNELMQELDTNGDGQISLQEFLDGWQKKIDGLKTNSSTALSSSAAGAAQQMESAQVAEIAALLQVGASPLDGSKLKEIISNLNK